MTQVEQVILTKLRSIKENDLSRNILVPLFQHLGYDRVEFQGGKLENGADLVLWGRDRLGNTELSVAQVKRFRFSRKAADSRGVEFVINQLISAGTRHLPHIDGRHYIPTSLLLITSHEVESHVLEKRLVEHPSLADRKVIVLDGVRLAALIIEKAPTLLTRLLGPTSGAQVTIAPRLSNNVLLAALGSSEKRDLQSIYIELDLSLGKRSSQLFLGHTQVSLKSKHFELSKSEWEGLTQVISDTSETFPTNTYLKSTVDAVAAAHRQRMKEHEEWESRIRKLRSKQLAARKAEQLARDHANKIEQEMMREPSALLVLRRNLERLKRATTASLRSRAAQQVQRDLLADLPILRRPLERLRTALESKKDFPIPREQLRSQLRDQIRQIEASISTAREIEKTRRRDRQYYDRQLTVEQQREPLQTFPVDADGNKLRVIIRQHRIAIEKSVQQFRRTSPTVSELRRFLRSVRSTLINSDRLLSHDTIREIVGLASDKIIRTEYDSLRLNVPLDVLLATGESLLLLGDAGAGKTTSLMMYARGAAHSDDNTPVVYCPLAHAAQAWRESGRNPVSGHAREQLEEGICLYLGRMGLSVAPAELASTFRSTGGTLLLDGLDEALRIAPWTVDAIGCLARDYPKLQIVVSSRISTGMAERIPFLAMTLLPFSDSQRARFLRNWFRGKDNRAVGRILRHLRNNSDLGEVVRTPLLTTVLCVLAENGVPLPDSEVRLYDDRLRLLTGFFDSVKRIPNRTLSRQDNLEIVARRLAFLLHSRNARSTSMNELESMYTSLVSSDVSEKNVVLAVSELIDPCNLLVPMTAGGELGFGHLRYQEHLAARELLLNRSIDICSLLPSPWWRGVFVLLAKMSQSMYWLFELAFNNDAFDPSYETMQAIVDSCPGSDQRAMQELLDREFEEDTSDDFEDKKWLRDDEVSDDIERSDPSQDDEEDGDANKGKADQDDKVEEDAEPDVKNAGEREEPRGRTTT